MRDFITDSEKPWKFKNPQRRDSKTLCAQKATVEGKAKMKESKGHTAILNKEGRINYFEGIFVEGRISKYKDEYKADLRSRWNGVDQSVNSHLTQVPVTENGSVKCRGQWDPSSTPGVHGHLVSNSSRMFCPGTPPLHISHSCLGHSVWTELWPRQFFQFQLSCIY